ncbi:MAG: serine hydrolase [Staphylococcus rostri]|uniref:serine hydrolase n=1 Tax=Staphylococcus rostri TaxID=522262 RepID=UPI0026E010CA|nr:serine hydrolase [Staphylococcus rostri]MDO5375447.1 serine hydrolase [Staphylococcus rostri]
MKNIHLEPLLSKNENLKSNPASLTKLLTLLTALDYPLSLEQEVEILPCDSVEDTRNPLNIGDVITINDIMHLMLLLSSNIAANVLARFVEETYLNKNPKQ